MKSLAQELLFEFYKLRRTEDDKTIGEKIKILSDLKGIGSCDCANLLLCPLTTNTIDSILRWENARDLAIVEKENLLNNQLNELSIFSSELSSQIDMLILQLSSKQKRIEELEAKDSNARKVVNIMLIGAILLLLMGTSYYILNNSNENSLKTNILNKLIK